MDYTVRGILQARILEWIAFPFSRGSSQPRDGTQVPVHCRQILYQLSYKGSQLSVKHCSKWFLFYFLLQLLLLFGSITWLVGT